jgi:hypothetical protein
MHRFALDNLRSRPVRAILSIVGLAVAIGGMVGLFSVAGGINKLVAKTFSMIPGILVQERGAPIPIFSTLPAEWQQEIEQVEGVSVVNPEVLVRVNLLENKPVISPPRFRSASTSRPETGSKTRSLATRSSKAGSSTIRTSAPRTASSAAPLRSPRRRRWAIRSGPTATTSRSSASTNAAP